MKYLQASRMLREASFSETRQLLLLSSAQVENLDIYLRAEFARDGIDCRIEHTPFNTLEQQLILDQGKEGLRACLLLPWDFLPALDWRSGIVSSAPVLEDCLERIATFTELLQQHGSACLFLDAPTPPLLNDRRAQRRLLQALRQGALQLCDVCIDADAFALESYLDKGVPINGRYCGEIAAQLVASLEQRAAAPRRVLVSDLDNVAWAGVIGEDGVDGIDYGPEGKGYPHFLYQGYLKKLQRAGILIAAVSKNDADLANLPFRQGKMPLDVDDLVTIQASYYPKSTQIGQIAESLNLPLDAFVFVDDNPVEIAEVGGALPEVTTLQFPAAAAELPAFLDRLDACFELRQATDEDRRRTALYQTRLKGMAPAAGDAATLLAFLQGLEMRLHIRDRSSGDNERALQLFNKTNQFNLNGRRIERDQLDRRLAAGARLSTAAVTDRYGDHGEVIACLQAADGAIELLVMSCRVFQRCIEHRFLAWIASRLPGGDGRLLFDYLPTDRNTPVRLFFEQQGLSPAAGRLALSRDDFLAANAAIEPLFELTVG